MNQSLPVRHFGDEDRYRCRPGLSGYNGGVGLALIKNHISGGETRLGKLALQKLPTSHSSQLNKSIALSNQQLWEELYSIMWFTNYLNSGLGG